MMNSCAICYMLASWWCVRLAFAEYRVDQMAAVSALVPVSISIIRPFKLIKESIAYYPLISACGLP